MAQISLPSSFISKYEYPNTTITAFNAVDFVDAINDASTAKYIQCADTSPVLGGGYVTFGMQALVDPLIDTGHVVHLIVRTSSMLDGSGNIFLAAYVWIADINENIIASASWNSDEVTSSFSEFTYTLTAEEVQAFRAAGCYGNSRGAVGFNSYHESDAAFFYLEVPALAGLPWWYNSNTDHYKYGADPGGSFISSAAPAFRTYGEENPVQGVSTGGTPIIIIGDGFADTATVTVNGVAATSIVVVDQHTITCTTPAYGGVFTETGEVDVGNGDIKSANVASVTITVTNPDGTSASI